MQLCLGADGGTLQIPVRNDWLPKQTEVKRPSNIQGSNARELSSCARVPDTSFERPSIPRPPRMSLALDIHYYGPEFAEKFQMLARFRSFLLRQPKEKRAEVLEWFIADISSIDIHTFNIAAEASRHESYLRLSREGRVQTSHPATNVRQDSVSTRIDDSPPPYSAV